jgi:hypothetical protein
MLYIFDSCFYSRMAEKNKKDPDWSKSEETGTKPSSAVQYSHEYPVGLNEENLNCEQAEPTNLDYGPENIARWQVALEETLSKPRKGTHVTDLVLCNRLRVVRKITELEEQLLIK